MAFFYLEEVDSTNMYAKEHIYELEDKTTVYTFNQTAGRGRLDRKWNCAGDGTLCASIVLKPSSNMKISYSSLTMYLGVVIAETLEEYGVHPVIKWPNDVLVNSKKICGILAELVSYPGKLEGLILGFGINLNSEKEELENISQPATSLKIECGKPVEPKEFLEKLMDNFFERYQEFLDKGFDLIKDEYVSRFGFLNKEITVKIFDKSVTGVAVGLNNLGALILLDSDNKEHTLLIGDIL